MKREETAIVAKPMWAGDKLYQVRAREALPVLVRQAMSGSALTYAMLARELDMLNPRNLNYVLGSVGQTLMDLSATWGKPIPPIQCLAVNAGNSTPGNGFGWFMHDQDWKNLSVAQRRRVTEIENQKIYAYPRWLDVLNALQLAPVKEDFSDLLHDASQFRAGGESDAHRRLKEYVSRHPKEISVRSGGQVGRLEEAIPSGDRIDVFFDTGLEWVAVECKPVSSDEADLTRGLYQCIKYAAVLRAMAGIGLHQDVHVRAVLVIGGKLPDRVRTLQVRLGVEVIEAFDVP